MEYQGIVGYTHFFCDFYKKANTTNVLAFLLFVLSSLISSSKFSAGLPGSDSAVDSYSLSIHIRISW